MIYKPENREKWLEMRNKGIGGSDAGTVLGVNKYKNNVQLWKEKTGQIIPADISDKPAVIFGKKAEEHIRELFKLDFPRYKVDYHEFYMYVNDRYPFIFATLDGEITDDNGRDFAVLKAYIRYYHDDSLRTAIRHFRIERSEVQTDIDYLIEKETEFWGCIKNGRQPALILPEI